MLFSFEISKLKSIFCREGLKTGKTLSKYEQANS